ncbi:MAG: hypothetical protein WDM85_01505 [Caulobacteraceae bacterium]
MDEARRAPSEAVLVTTPTSARAVFRARLSRPATDRLLCCVMLARRAMIVAAALGYASLWVRFFLG